MTMEIVTPHADRHPRPPRPRRCFYRYRTKAPSVRCPYATRIALSFRSGLIPRHVSGHHWNRLAIFGVVHAHGSHRQGGTHRTVAYLDQLSVTRSRPSTDGHRTSDASDAGMAIATPDTNPHCMNSMAATWKLSFAYRHQPHCRARDDLGRYSSTAGFEITLSQNACRVRPVALVTRPAVFPGIPLFSHEPGPGRHCSQLAVFDLAGLRESESRSRLPGITCTCLLQTTHLA